MKFLRELFDIWTELIDRFTFGFAVGVIFTVLIMYFWSIPRMIERRGMDLNLYQYNGKEDEFIIRDSIKMNSWDFHYLQHGNFKKELLTR